MTGHQLVDPTPDGVRCRDVAMTEVMCHGLAIEFRAESGQRTQGLQFGSERKIPCHPAVVEGLLAESVTEQLEGAVPPVPNGCGEHALTSIECPIDSPILDRPH